MVCPEFTPKGVNLMLHFLIHGAELHVQLTPSPSLESTSSKNWVQLTLLSLNARTRSISRVAVFVPSSNNLLLREARIVVKANETNDVITTIEMLKAAITSTKPKPF